VGKSIDEIKALFDAYKNGTITMNEIDNSLKEFSDISYNKTKQSILSEYEKKLGVNSMDEIQKEIEMLKEAQKRASNIPQIESAYQKQIDEMKQQLEKLQKAKTDEQLGIKQKYEQEIEQYRNLYTQQLESNNKNKLRADISRYAAETGIDPELRERFADYLISSQNVKMEFDKNSNEYYPTTSELDYKVGDMPMKKAYSRNEFKDGINTIYSSDPLLQKMFPKVEKQNSGFGISQHTQKSSFDGGLEQKMANMTTDQARSYFMNEVQKK
jgi:hypothetical protein